MAEKKFTTSNTKMPNWFSWRHETSQEHLDEQARIEGRRLAKQVTIERNQLERSKRTPQQQLDVLNRRGYDAVKERARLQKLITSTTKEA